MFTLLSMVEPLMLGRNGDCKKNYLKSMLIYVYMLVVPIKSLFICLTAIAYYSHALIGITKGKHLLQES